MTAPSLRTLPEIMELVEKYGVQEHADGSNGGAWPATDRAFESVRSAVEALIQQNTTLSEKIAATPIKVGPYREVLDALVGASTMELSEALAGTFLLLGAPKQSPHVMLPREAVITILRAVRAALVLRERAEAAERRALEAEVERDLARRCAEQRRRQYDTPHGHVAESFMWEAAANTKAAP